MSCCECLLQAADDQRRDSRKTVQLWIHVVCDVQRRGEEGGGFDLILIQTLIEA
jgi:hypothetical protein